MEAVNPRRSGRKREIMWAAADACVCWLCFSLLTDFFFSAYAQRFALPGGFLKASGALTLLCLCVAALSQHAALNRRLTRKALGLQLLLRIPAHILLFLLMLLNLETVHFRFFPPGDFHDTHGMLYFFASGFYLIASVLLRLGIFLIHLVKASQYSCPTQEA